MPRNALLVRSGSLPKVGTPTRVAGLEVVREVGPQNVASFCPDNLSTEVLAVLDKTHAAERIIAADGCPLHCALKRVERPSFTLDRIITMVLDCGL